MRQDLTTHVAATTPIMQPQSKALRIAWLLGAMLAGVLLITLAYQVPATHAVALGGYAAAYTQGFHDPLRADGQGRWTHESSFLLFPQIGLPAELTLRLRSPHTAPLTVLLNGITPLGTLTPSADWQEYRFPITNGLAKPSDVVIELRSAATAPISEQDSRQVGVLLDRAELRTTAWPILPYPVPVGLGGLAGGLLALLVQGEAATARRRWLIGMGLITVAFLCFYRLQPPYPYPLRGLLPALNVALVAAVGLRYGPAVLRHMPRLVDVAAFGVVAAWFGAVLVQAQQHLVLSLPGVENDFRVFALRSAHLVGTFEPSGVYDRASDGVLRADGFYNLGYPFLLWLLRPLTSDNPFLAARIVAAASGALVLLALWVLARRLLGIAGGLLAVGCLALSPLFTMYSLYLGTDMPFAAACIVAVALCAWQATSERSSLLLVGAAGAAAGAAFLLRHPGLLLLPFGWLALGVGMRHAGRRSLLATLGVFTLAFGLMITPQLYVNLRDTGSPLFSQQAKNIWLAVYANSDWSRGGEVPNSIGLSEVVLRDPVRFFGNWATNIRGFLGAGGEDVSEFGRADQLRLLAFPMNWLAIAVLGAWLVGGWRRGDGEIRRQGDTATVGLVSVFPCLPGSRLLLAWVALYVLGVSVGLSLVRFVLPLAPIYALAAAWATLWLAQQLERWLGRWPQFAGRALPALALGLALLLAGGFGTGTGFVLQNQHADELAAVQLVQSQLAVGETVRMELPPRALFDTYSAIAHKVVAPGQIANFALRPADIPAETGEQAVDSAGGYTLWRTGAVR